MKFRSGLNLRKIFKTNTYEFCENTTLHGIKYLANKELKHCESFFLSFYLLCVFRYKFNISQFGKSKISDVNLFNISKRCFFAISIVTAVCFVTYLIFGVYNKWETSPVIVGINPKRKPIANEPFPAVTICNLNLALKTKVSHFAKNSTEQTMLRLLCKRKVHKQLRETIKTWDNLEDFVKNVSSCVNNIMKDMERFGKAEINFSGLCFQVLKKNFFKKISPSCEDMLVACRFGGRKFKCRELFYPLITDGGLCCVFNMLHPKFMYISQDRATSAQYDFKNLTFHEYVNWSAEYGYGEITDPYSTLYPYRVPGVGESIGLSVSLNVHKNNYFCSAASSVGFKFTLHSPNEWPSVKELGVYLEPGKETKIHITPDKVETSRRLKSIKPYYRGCLFTNEQQLQFFSHYTQRNCEMEFMAKALIETQNCSPFYMPKIQDNITVCSPYYKKIQLLTDIVNVYNLHDCLPSCNDLNFHIESFSTKLIQKGSYVNDKILKHLNNSYIQNNIAIVHMFFKDNSFRTYKQMEFIGLSDFLSSIGGLMSLFLGFSFISISELIYFAVLRPIRSFIEYYRNFKTIRQHLDNDIHQLSTSIRKSNKIRKLLQNRHNRFMKRSRILERNIHTEISHRNIALISSDLF